MQKECPMCHGTRILKSNIFVGDSNPCSLCQGTGYVDVPDEKPRTLNFPPIALGVKKRTVAINTINDLIVLGNYLEMKAPEGTKTPVIFEDEVPLEAAVWESMDGGYMVEIRRVK